MKILLKILYFCLICCIGVFSFDDFFIEAKYKRVKTERSENSSEEETEKIEESSSFQKASKKSKTGNDNPPPAFFSNFTISGFITPVFFVQRTTKLSVVPLLLLLPLYILYHNLKLDSTLYSS